ncbi:uncharacterized protein LOC125683740 isoform X1 [Ostrea edulis]|uniref:uncharacterized protein LOC125683740 isoform X1 n=1 Tax=Ostrea edulis TaxID=37623 RepID=UPI0024AEE7C8|nr:uncharacterized protein LOC125683740 isoform X1 [Ostrea edulis]
MRMALLFITLGILLLIQGINAKYYCEESWLTNPSNGFCYKLFPDLQPWKQARNSCTKHGGFLVSVTDTNEQQFIAKDVLQNNETSSAWIGGHSLYSDDWVWDDYQREFNFTQWAAGEPVSTSRCIAMLGASGFNWSGQSCADRNVFICEKPAQVLYCDGKANIIHLEGNKLTSVSFPPFYDPLRPFQFPSYEKNLNCVWRIIPPMGYKIVMEFDLFCNDDLKALSGYSSLDDITCQVHSGNVEVDSTLMLSFTTNSFTKPRSEQGFQLRLFATNGKESSCDPAGIPLVASSEKQIVISPGFPYPRSSSCVWTIMSPVKASNIYVQFKYRYISEGAELQIQDDVFTRSSMLEESRVLIYPAEKIVVNYTSNVTYPGHHGFSLDYYTDKESVDICTQNLVPKVLSEYGIPNPKEQFLIFSVKATKDIEVDLHTATGEDYLITSNQEHSGYSYCLRKTSTSSCVETYNDTISHYGFQDLWVTWTDILKVGRGRILGEHVVMEYRLHIPLNVNSSSIQTKNGTGVWKFYGFLTDFVEVCHTSETPLKSLWDYHLPVQGQNHLTFSVMICERALITFQTRVGNSYRIWLDALQKGSSTFISCITNYTSDSGVYPCITSAYSHRVLNCSEFREFWISWGRSAGLQIGKGKSIGTDTMISSVSENFTPVKESAFKFGSSKADTRYITSVWRFSKAPPNPENITIIRSGVVPSLQEVEGAELTMSVDINLRFGFEVKWLRNGTHVTQSPGRFLVHQTFIDVMRCSLTIVELKLRDEANWTVVISNQHSKATLSFDIKVKPGIQIKISPHYQIAVQKGTALELVCNITNLGDLQGFPVDISSLVWFKDGIKIPEGQRQEKERITMITDQSFRLLRIYPTEESDKGTYSCTHDKYKVPGVINTTVDIYNTGQIICESEKDVYGILWPTAIPGNLIQSDCPDAGQGNASRLCDDYGTWKKTSVSYCTDTDFSNALNEVQVLENDGISDKKYIEQTFESSLRKTENLTASKTVISSGNLLSSMDIIKTVLKVATQSNASVPERNVYGIVDNVASSDNKDSWKLVEEETYSGPSSVLDIMDRTNSLLIKDARANEYRGQNIVVNISEVSLHESGIKFLENDSFMVLPEQQQQQATKFSAVLYKTMSQFLPTTSNTSGERVINSVVMSLTLEKSLHDLSPPLELVFQHNKGEYNLESWANTDPWVYQRWDQVPRRSKHPLSTGHIRREPFILISNDGGWSTEGCSINSTQDGTSVCLCNHTTNFAILMRPYTPTKEDSALVIISIVGCVISMLFGLLTICVYVIVWKSIKSDQNVLIICLCVSLFLAYLLLLAGVDNSQNEAACVVVTALLHYLLLLTFFMMLGVGTIFFMNVTVLFYAMHITNKFNSRSRLKWILGFATCIPLVIVFITLGSCWNTKYHADTFCWLSVSSGAIYAFIAPVLVIFVLNICIIVSLVRVMFLTTKMKNAEIKEKARYALRSVCTLVPVLGVTWVFGIFAINEDAVVFQYIFTIFNSIQGLLIFITHVLLNAKIRKALIAKYPCLKRKRNKGAYKEKDQARVPSTTSENFSSTTQSMALVPSSYTEYRDPEKVSESDVQMETEEMNFTTADGKKVIEKHLFVTKMETRIEGGKFIAETEDTKHFQTDQETVAFKSVSSSNAFNERTRKEEVRWGGGGIIGGKLPFQSEGKKYEEMRLTKEVRVRHTNIETSRVVSSNTSQFSMNISKENNLLQNKIHFSQLTKDDEEFDA